MTKTILAASLLGAATLLSGTPAAFAAADPAGMVPDFSALDTDGDGTLTEGEWMKSPAVSAMGREMAEAHYKMYDIDKDGKVSGQEYADVNEQTFDQMEKEAI